MTDTELDRKTGWMVGRILAKAETAIDDSQGHRRPCVTCAQVIKQMIEANSEEIRREMELRVAKR